MGFQARQGKARQRCKMEPHENIYIDTIYIYIHNILYIIYIHT